MANDNPEYAYRWDATFSNFFKDSKDYLNNDLFGSQSDASEVDIYNNSFVGIYGKIARFDGKYWHCDQIESTHNSPYGNYYSYGDDIVVRPVEYVAGTINFKGGRKVFDPNTLQWLPDYIMDGANRGRDMSNVGINYYYYGNGCYYRQANGLWNKIYTSSNNPIFVHSIPPNLNILCSSVPNEILEIRSLKNGISSNIFNLPNSNLLYDPYEFKSLGDGNQTIISFPRTVYDHKDATSLQLNRFINDDLIGLQYDFPVTGITVYDGNQYLNTSFDYDGGTATIDPTGNIAQYYKITVIPGSNLVSNKPNGYTENYFNNGLSSVELNESTFFSSDLKQIGVPYRTKIFDSNNNLVSTTENIYQTFTKIIKKQ